MLGLWAFGCEGGEWEASLSVFAVLVEKIYW